MSTTTGRAAAIDLEAVTRALAVGGGLVLTGAYVSVLHDVVSVVRDTPTLTPAGDGTGLFLVVVAASMGLATLLALAVSPRVAAGLAAVLLAGGAAVYMQAAPLGWQLLGEFESVLSDSWVLLAGTSVLRMQTAGAWALGFAPTPVFLSWYLFVRRRYALGVGVGGLALLLFVLTGDAGATLTLAGVVGGAAAVGVGELERRGLSLPDVELLVVVLAAMVVVTTTVSIVPAGGGGAPFVPGGDPTVEGNVVAAGDQMDIVGSVSLSPEVRFTVESNRPAYWRVGAYDRYTGQGWVRSGQSTEYDADDLAGGRPGERIVQQVSVRSRMQVIPSAWRPTRLGGDAEDVARISSLRGLTASEPLEPGDEYTVVSQRPAPGESELRTAGDDYPDKVEDRYTQLPGDTPERLERFTDRVTEDADGPYEQAERIQAWLESNKDYSLNVERPDGNVASSFVFDMEAGYCTYFATAMTAMLRTQDVPARMVVGYTTGQQVAEDEWVVRGYNAHAWVEVYFPTLGWVKFDPTPATPREDAQRDRLDQARENDNDEADTDRSEDGAWTPTPTATPTPDPGGGTPTATATPGDNGTAEQETPPGLGDVGEVTPTGGPASGSSGFQTPPTEVLAFGLVLVAGVVAGVRRSHAVGRLRRFAGLYWQRRGDDPAADIHRAVERLEYALARSHRRRRTGESRRAYLTTIAALEGDDRLRRVALLHDRATYAGDADAATADETVALADELVREYAPMLSRLGGA